MSAFRPSRLPLLFMAIASLLLGLSGGLARFGWTFSALPPAAATHHGLIMVAGFLGTLISLERAVGSTHRWSYIAPVLTGLGTLIGVALGSLTLTAPILLAGAIVMALHQILHAHEHPSASTRTFALGAICLAIGCALTVLSHSEIVLWWILFLALAITAERLELSKILAPPRYAKILYTALIAILFLSAALATLGSDTGTRIVGAALLGLAAWLARFDLARKSIRRAGLARFISITLLSGFCWLGLSGILLLIFANRASYAIYDATLHSFFLGFVFSMIFAHAPIIFPTVLGLPIVFRHRFYAHMLLLHLGVLSRIITDIFGYYTGQRWSALINALSILFFLAQTVSVLGQGKSFPTITPAPHPPEREK